jgi:hypothetical protein
LGAALARFRPRVRLVLPFSGDDERSIHAATLLALRNDARADDARSQHAAVFLMRATRTSARQTERRSAARDRHEAAIAPNAK